MTAVLWQCLCKPPGSFLCKPPPYSLTRFAHAWRPRPYRCEIDRAADGLAIPSKGVVPCWPFLLGYAVAMPAVRDDFYDALKPEWPAPDSSAAEVALPGLPPHRRRWPLCSGLQLTRSDAAHAACTTTRSFEQGSTVDMQGRRRCSWGRPALVAWSLASWAGHRGVRANTTAACCFARHLSARGPVTWLWRTRRAAPGGTRLYLWITPPFLWRSRLECG